MEKEGVKKLLEIKGFVKFDEIKKDLYLCPFGFVEIREVDGEIYIKHIVNERIKVEK